MNPDAVPQPSDFCPFDSGNCSSRDSQGMALYANASWPSEVADMPTKNVVLTDYQTELLERLVSSGRYQNASEVLREGLRLVEDQEAEGKARIKALRAAARKGVADVEGGRYRTFDSPSDLSQHLEVLRNNALSRKG